MTKRVLVTGSSGVIGSKVVEFLLTSGFHVIAFDKRPPGIGCENWGSAKNLNVVVDDILNKQAVDLYVSQCDRVIHLAAPMSILQFEEDPAFCFKETVDGFVNTIEAVRNYNIKHFVTASSGAVYEGLPTSDLPYNEAASINPPDLKAFAKLVTEQIAYRYLLRYGVNTVIIRPQSVYSPAEGSKGPIANVISLFAWAMACGQRPIIWGSGSQTRDFVYVDDAAKAFILASNLSNRTDIFNLCSGVETSFVEIIDFINHQMGTALRPHCVKCPLPIYSQRFVGSPEKAALVLNFNCSISVSEGINRVIAQAIEDVRKRSELGLFQTGYRSMLEL